MRFDHSKEGARRMLDDLGETFDAEDEASFVSERLPSGVYILKETWDSFLGILKEVDRLERAFEAAWPDGGFVRMAIGKGMVEMDAEDLDIVVATESWQALKEGKYQPWRLPWKSFLYVIWTRRFMNAIKHASMAAGKLKILAHEILVHGGELVPRSDDPKEPYGNSYQGGIFEVREHKEPVVIIEQDRGWSIPQICAEWMDSDNWPRIVLADEILNAYQGNEVFKPAGIDVANRADVSKQYMHQLFQEFIEEVLKRESYGR